ncbi:MAG: hypothetical protein QOC77_1790 [Thermoleophilaceae bacterium]|nr:hypothetical protein [Thermoleophilaceae bacterium]
MQPTTKPYYEHDAGLRKRVSAKKCGEQCAPRSGEGWRYFVYGQRPEPMPAFIGPLEGPYEGRRGIACSGGGIRSAAFNLGALQSLEEAGELRKADYLAAVSGGSYIAAAFSMVAKRWPKANGTDRPPEPDGNGEPDAEPDGEPDDTDISEGHDDSNPVALEKLGPFARNSPEEQYLRNRSSYMAPSGSDKLFLGVRVVLALLFNLVFLSLPLFAAGLVLGATLYRGPAVCDATACRPVIDLLFWIPPALVALAGIALALVGLILRPTSDKRRQFLQTWSTRLLLLAAGLVLVLVVAPAFVKALQGDAVQAGTGKPNSKGVIGGAGGLVGLLAGIIAYARQAVSSPKAAAQEAGKVRKALGGLSSRVRLLVMYAAGALFGPLLLFLALVLGASVALGNSDSSSVQDGVIIAMMGAIAAFALLYSIADVNSWSLHPFYKRRLSTAFALKRIRDANFTPEERERVQLVPPVTDQANDVGAAIERDYDELVALSDTALDKEETDWPTLLVCAAANVSDPGASPPGRSVTSFTFSAHSIGGPLIGGAKTSSYEEAVGAGKRSWPVRLLRWVTSSSELLEPRRRRDLSLVSAVAMSGAALSPSMGKMTRKPLTFLLALANVRLGVWLPNPRAVMLTPADQRKLIGRPRPWYLIQELLGRNRVNAKYVYVTDGGHYENLGLVELFRRGCTRIFCFDASGGESSKELGDAIALARSELGVEVDIDPRPLIPDKETAIAKADTVVGTFRYNDPDKTEGTLVYARNVLTAPVEPPDPPDAPWDVHAYHEVDPKFPHNSTVDQLYTDQKFEGYRVLGEVAGKRAIAKMRVAHPGE